jgi:hypothetical protein
MRVIADCGLAQPRLRAGETRSGLHEASILGETWKKGLEKPAGRTEIPSIPFFALFLWGLAIGSFQTHSPRRGGWQIRPSIGSLVPREGSGSAGPGSELGRLPGGRPYPASHTG